MKVSASIVTYKTDPTELLNCINAIKRNKVSLVYVIDNSPTNKLGEVCASIEGVVYIFNDNNLGYGTAHNIAIRKTQEQNFDYHLVINSDVSFGDDVIEKLTEYMESEENQDVAQVIPNTYYPDGRLQYVVRLLPTPANPILRRFLPDCVVKPMNNRYCLMFNDHTQPMNVPFHQGCFMFFRVKCFETAGMFDERFFLYAEDIDITRRMHKHFRTMFYPGTSIIHFHRAESYRSFKMLKIHIVNMIRYFNKWGWFFDKERTEWNKKLLKELGYKS
jgi:GT2 family glycosyltransferase